MRLHGLHVTAFGPFGGRQDIDFDALSAAGLFLLHGPTGAGKTSVLDAVCYALYGSVPGARGTGGQGTGLRSDHADPGIRTEVRLEFSVAGRRLEITRQPPWERPKRRGSGTTTDKAHSALREYDAATGSWRGLSRSHQEIGEEIGLLLGMSKEQFCQVVLLPQGDFARFLRADAEARGRLLGRLFDTRRFAAVEQYLAERRRAGEAAVRDADAALLADAHRIQQAAGDALELPLPDVAPGDPGLAVALLTWAAVARCGARELLAVRTVSLAAAEAAAAGAARHLGESRELHRLQRRFAEARERADRLAASADEHHRDQLALERARKAEAVAPALRLRDAAADEHSAARAAGERARAALPAELSGAGAPALAAAARRAAEELGALETARRAEHRLSEIVEERTALDRQERADDDLLQEAEGWLADWAPTRAALQDAIDTAQDAAARTEHLAARVESAEARLAAALRRDDLAAEAAAAQEHALAARERAGAAHERWLDLKEQRLRSIAAELAAGLVDGRPCDVCGATRHPSPARKSAGHVDAAAEEAALAAHRRAEEARGDAERRLSGAREALAAATAEASATATPQLAEEADNLRRQYAEAHRTASGAHAAREALATAEQEHGRRLAAQQEAARRAASRASLRDALDRERATLEEELTRARGTEDSVAARARRLERRVVLLTDAADAARAADDTAQRVKDADARLADAAFRAGFDTPGEAAAALLDPARQRALQHRLDTRRQEEAAVRAVLAEQDTAAAAGRPPADPGAAERTAATAERTLRETASARDAAERRCTELDRLSTRATAAAGRLAPLRAGHDRVARIAALAAGTSAENDRRMRLESYVLAARLEQVAAAASARLRRMSQGRYTLVHSDDRAGRGRSGLGLHVVDAWTGRERDTATLSGGETFFASLALALGLADVVTDEAGGVRLDTLFIDEGFGSLDDQTLDEVLDVLDALRERDRSVGIVSHVADLRRRIHAQLEVVKGRDGSFVRQREAGMV
ncbi:nuclease SbcCD subunit C [Streptomyces sulfonofaciens]|uniref:Nuclease SbcCD subunit C n=1 Tax=Streptomyces sulfonofaciens TaxID=68272 RepID=A0A919GJ31_9ACTN|nr:SMC family ATPase [Streptomyces sulfonofaciens]GHH85049.1 nuclease SbcCD subunit C [Streptomyces sulfonofaciens]